MPDLLVRPATLDGPSGETLNVTPDRTGFEYLTFRARKLAQGDVYLSNTGANELGLVLLGGIVRRLLATLEQPRECLWRDADGAVFAHQHRIHYHRRERLRLGVLLLPRRGKLPCALDSPRRCRGRSARRCQCYELAS